MLRLRPGLTVAWRGPGRVQLGLGEHGTVLDGLTPADEQLLTGLAAGAPLQSLLALAERLGAPEQRVHDLLAELRAAGALASPGGTPSSGLPAADRQRLAPDAAVLGLAYPHGDGWQVLTRRRDRCVAVLGPGRTGLAVATAAAAAGVGTVLVDTVVVDPDEQARLAPVTAADVAPGGWRDEDVGRPRVEAARDVLARRYPGTRTSAPPGTRPDVVVLVVHGAADPVRCEALVREDVPHLPVVWGERGVEVGPLVVPGVTGCLRCQHLHRTDRDPQWPRVLAQVTGRRTPGAEETALAALAASLAVVQVLAHLDGGQPAVRDAALEVSLPDGEIAARPWPPHPRCGCRWPPGVAPGAPGGTMAG